MQINSYVSGSRTYVALNMNTFVRFKPNKRGVELIDDSPVRTDEFAFDDDGFYRVPMHIFVQAFGADLGTSAAYVQGNTIAVCIDEVIIPNGNSTEPLACDCCGYNFENLKDYENLYHFAGKLNGKVNNHIHACTDCVVKYELAPVDIITKESINS